MSSPHACPQLKCQVYSVFRELRALTTENLPSSDTWTVHELYKLLYSFDVEALLLRSRKSPSIFTRFLGAVHLGTPEQAATVQHLFDNYSLPSGHRIHVSFSKPLMRVLGSVTWSGGRPGVHNSPRDQGGASGTNFEKVSSFVFYTCCLSSIQGTRNVLLTACCRRKKKYNLYEVVSRASCTNRI